MNQIIPYVKEIVFKSNIASIVSISLDHEEIIKDGEISGDFIVYGEYKEHNDTTEKELFKYRLPFQTTLMDENIIEDTIKVDIKDFTYNQVEEDVIKVNIDFTVDYETSNKEIEDQIEKLINDNFKEKKEEIVKQVEKNPEPIKEIKDDFITYHIHIVKENQTLEEIVKEYDTNIEIIKEYNDIDKIKEGDKLIIPNIK